MKMSSVPDGPRFPGEDKSTPPERASGKKPLSSLPPSLPPPPPLPIFPASRRSSFYINKLIHFLQFPRSPLRWNSNRFVETTPPYKRLSNLLPFPVIVKDDLTKGCFPAEILLKFVPFCCSFCEELPVFCCATTAPLGAPQVPSRNFDTAKHVYRPLSRRRIAF